MRVSIRRLQESKLLPKGTEELHQMLSLHLQQQQSQSQTAQAAVLAAQGSATSTATFNNLPLNLQLAIFASGGAPLNTCKATAAILQAQHASELCQWLLAAK
jgi:hypothetical protein